MLTINTKAIVGQEGQVGGMGRLRRLGVVRQEGVVKGNRFLGMRL